MARDATQQALFERSGCYGSRSMLVSFLYDLMRDHVPPGVVESLLKDCPPTETTFSNGWLALYADDVARRLAPELFPKYHGNCCSVCGARPGEPCDPGLHG